jgi:hypothetical protein
LFFLRTILPVAAMLVAVGALTFVIVSDVGFDDDWPDGGGIGEGPTVRAPFPQIRVNEGLPFGGDAGARSRGRRVPVAVGSGPFGSTLPIPPDVATAFSPPDASPTDHQYGRVTPQAGRLLYP